MTPTGGRGRDRNNRPPSESPAVRPNSAPPAAPLAHGTKMTISSVYGEDREVQRLIREEVERNHFDSDSQFAIKLALEEAIINAIKHGNKQDRAKRVQVEWRVSPKSVEIVIEDEGPGFTRTAVPDPTDETNLEKLTGRGILLIEAYMNEVEWSQGGRRIRFVKHNQNDPQTMPTPGARSA